MVLSVAQHLNLFAQFVARFLSVDIKSLHCGMSPNRFSIIAVQNMNVFHTQTNNFNVLVNGDAKTMAKCLSGIAKRANYVQIE